MARNERTRKVRRIRRGGGVRNFFKGLFTRRGPPLPAPGIQPTTPSRWKFPNIRRWFKKSGSKTNPVTVNEYRKINFSKLRTETFAEGFERLVWYLKKRMDGKTHSELLPNLKKPGSMIPTQEDFNAVKNTLLEYLDRYDADAAEKLKMEIFHSSDLDKEINAWERGYPETGDEMAKVCSKGKDGGRCILYANTGYDKIAEGNIANGLSRVIGLLKMKEKLPEYLKKSTNQRVASECDEGQYILFTTPDVISETKYNLYNICVSKDFFSEHAAYLCLEHILQTRFLLDAFQNNGIYFMSPVMALWLQETHPDLFAVGFGTQSGWGYEDKTHTPYTWKLSSSLERIRMLTIQHYFAKQVYVETEGDGNAARQFFLTFPEPAVSALFRLRENNDRKYNALSAEFLKNQQDVISSKGNTNTNSVMTLDEYIQYLEQRHNLFTRPPSQPSQPSLPPINLSAAVPYDAETALTNINRVNYLERKFRNPLMNIGQKAHARTLLNIARRQKQQGNIFMTEKEFSTVEPFFKPKTRPNWTRRVGRGRRA